MVEVATSVEDLNEVTKQATVKIPAELVQQEVADALDKLTSSTQLKGFRPGKAPRQMVEKVHGSRVRYEVANRLISESLRKLMGEITGDIIGMPEIEVSSMEPGQEICYTANISLMPKPLISGYDRMLVEVPKAEVSDHDVTVVIERLCNSKAEHRPVSGRAKVEAGDVVDATLQVIEAGAPGEAAEPLVVGLGEGQLPLELEQGFLGMEIGETRKIAAVIPDTHPNKEIAGKQVDYVINLKGIAEKVLPELTDEFVKGLGFPEVQTVIELRLDIRRRLEEERQRESQEDVHKAVLELLGERNEFLVPELLVDEEIRTLVVRSGLIDAAKLKESNFPVDPWRPAFYETAKKRVKLAVIVDRVAEQEQLHATDEDLQAYVENIAGANNLPLAEVQRFFADESRRNHTKKEVTRNKVIGFLAERAEVNYTAPTADAVSVAAEGD